MTAWARGASSNGVNVSVDEAGGGGPAPATAGTTNGASTSSARAVARSEGPGEGVTSSVRVLGARAGVEAGEFESLLGPFAGSDGDDDGELSGGEESGYGFDERVQQLRQEAWDEAKKVGVGRGCGGLLRVSTLW